MNRFEWNGLNRDVVIARLAPINGTAKLATVFKTIGTVAAVVAIVLTLTIAIVDCGFVTVGLACFTASNVAGLMATLWRA